MDATLTEPEEMLRSTVRQVAANLACESVHDYEHVDSSKAWDSLAELGLLGIRLPESIGGGGASTFDEAIVVEALAHSALVAPYLGGAAFVGELLIAAGAPDETLERLASGELRCCVALSADLSELWGSSARGEDSAVAFDSAGSGAALVLEAGNGSRLRAVSLCDPVGGLDITRCVQGADLATTIDIGPLGGPIEQTVLARALARLLALVSADLVGAMEASLEAAVSYASSREQFGVPIGTFQAVQHLCADLYVSLEGARSLAEYAAWAVDECGVDEAMLAARSAKAYCSSAARTVCEGAVQVHGGMGFTWDCMAHVYLKRVLLDALVLGDAPTQIPRIAALRAGRAA